MSGPSERQGCGYCDGPGPDCCLTIRGERFPEAKPASGPSERDEWSRCDMTGPSERDEIAAIAEALVRIMLPASGDECSLSELRAYAVRILASDWLAERDRRTAAKAVREAARDMSRGLPTYDPHRNGDSCYEPSHVEWLADRANEIEADQ